MSLLACLQGMPSLRRLDLDLSISSESSSQPSTNKDIILLSKLTRSRYRGDGLVLDALVAGLSAPSLRDIHVLFFNEIWPPTVHLTRFIDDIQEHYHAIHVNFVGSISLLTQSECIGRRAPRFNLFPAPTKAPNYSHFPAILQMSGVISTRFTTVEELRVTITSDEVDTKIFWENLILWLQHMARALLQDHEGAEGYLPLLPALEEIELKKDRFESRHRPDAQLAAFKPFAYARQQAGRPVKIFFGQYTSL
ncbi:hypothetical protein BJV77DRAFT_995306 [Russula vinacea]|nr:hypothetical protein BJV77DRAFT_995306 [Russula vinacea]